MQFNLLRCCLCSNLGGRTFISWTKLPKLFTPPPPPPPLPASKSNNVVWDVFLCWNVSSPYCPVSCHTHDQDNSCHVVGASFFEMSGNVTAYGGWWRIATNRKLHSPSNSSNPIPFRWQVPTITSPLLWIRVLKETWPLILNDQSKNWVSIWKLPCLPLHTFPFSSPTKQSWLHFFLGLHSA